MRAESLLANAASRLREAQAAPRGVVVGHRDSVTSPSPVTPPARPCIHLDLRSLGGHPPTGFKGAIGALAVAVVLAAGCTSGPSATDQPTTVRPTTGTRSTAPPTTASGPATGTALTATDWPTYHHDNARTGAANLAPLGQLTVAWRAALDGAVYGQPLVVGGQVLAATEQDTVYALAATTGQVRWSTQLGTPVPGSDLPCGDVDPLGITSTMAYDPATALVFAVAETTGGLHTLVGIDVTTGVVRVRVPVQPPLGSPLAHQQRAALTVLAGRVYIAYGGLYGDCANYVGSVVSVTTQGADPLSYAVPTPREGGIWAPGGGVVDNGDLLYAVGNGESGTGYDGSDSVLALSADLRRVDLFAPAGWAQDNASDLDLGSAGPTVVGPWVFTAGKRGVGYVLRATHLGGVGGQVAQLDVCRSFGGSAVVGTTAYLPCTDGPRALSIDATGTPTVSWHAAIRAAGSPTVGGGAVWVLDYAAGVLYALDVGSGAVRGQLAVGALPHFASPTLSGSRAYVGTMAGVTAVGGA
jgi:polyvinyl alcohol dehydrogenase (cytochrome)